MKSKRAGVFIASLGLQSDRVLSRIKHNSPLSIRPSNEDLMKLVELAEADARDRAVRAFCATCTIPECPGDWKESDGYIVGCQGAPQKFLNHYDNEQ